MVRRATAEATLEATALRRTRKSNHQNRPQFHGSPATRDVVARARVGYHEGVGQVGDNDTASLLPESLLRHGLILAACRHGEELAEAGVT
jgi:hypothetical protein